MSEANKDRNLTTSDKTLVEHAARQKDVKVTEEDKKRAPTDLERLLEQTGVTSRLSSSKGEQEFQTGLKYGADPDFVDISLDDEPRLRDDADYELITHHDTSYQGRQYRSYNGQADHVRKYPKNFGKEGQGK